MLGIAISGTKNNNEGDKDGVDFCFVEIPSMDKWEQIKEAAKTGWQVFPNRTIEISEEMNQAFMKRLDEHKPALPDKPEVLRGENQEVPIPSVETMVELGGFTMIYGNHVIIFRYNTKLRSIDQMLAELRRIYFIEFAVRQRLEDPRAYLIPSSLLTTPMDEFMTRLPSGGILLNFWNHTMEDNLRERFADTFKQTA
jgi:hypothetical protein